MTITPFDIYLINMADKVLNATTPVAEISFACFCATCFVLVMACDTKQTKDNCKLIIKTAGIVFALSAPLAMFVPSTKTLAAMYVLPAIVNNEHIQNSTGNALEALENLTKEWLKDSIKNSRDTKKEKEI